MKLVSLRIIIGKDYNNKKEQNPVTPVFCPEKKRLEYLLLFYSFSYGMPSAAGTWPLPITPASTIMVAMYGSMSRN